MELDVKDRAMLLERAYAAALRAGGAIMEVYTSGEKVDFSLRKDNSPFTWADRVAHEAIKAELGPTRIPILSEEGRNLLYEERRNWEMLWIVDPLDGTQEFIEGFSEFTVNIGLVYMGSLLGAVIYVPCRRKIYFAQKGKGSYLVENVDPQSAGKEDYQAIMSRAKRLPLESERRDEFLVAVSRSHQNEQTQVMYDRMAARHPKCRKVVQGSSYKFCLLAEGAVDYYPRMSVTYEWDTAAAELILEEAGGRTRTLPEGGALAYNKEDLRNPCFECFAPGVE